MVTFMNDDVALVSTGGCPEINTRGRPRNPNHCEQEPGPSHSIPTCRLREHVRQGTQSCNEQQGRVMKHFTEGASCRYYRGKGARPSGRRRVKKARRQECPAPQSRRTLCSLKAALLCPLAYQARGGCEDARVRQTRVATRLSCLLTTYGPTACKLHSSL